MGVLLVVVSAPELQARDRECVVQLDAQLDCAFVTVVVPGCMPGFEAHNTALYIMRRGAVDPDIRVCQELRTAAEHSSRVE